MKSIKKALKILALAVLALNPAIGFGQELTATETAEIGVEALLKTVENAKGYFLTDKDLYFSEIEGVLNTFVDFEAVAEVVMNRYASAASELQKQRFANILKTTLTRFYGASLISYSGEQLIFLPPSSPESDPRADTIVGMELRGSDMNLRLQYQMFINENNEWKLKNLSLAGINLGRQYFTQFSALMSEYDEDINLVLDNWQ
jgi:phospholipid transport system substrate-binding protein